MKNSLPLLALGVILFLWACSTTKEDDTPISTPDSPTTPLTVSIDELDFLKKVQDKIAYAHATIQNDATKLGTFSADGKSFVSSGLVGSADILTLEEVIDLNTVRYTFIDPSDNNKIHTFTMFTLDGITGTASSEDPDSGIITTTAWLVTP